MRCRPGGEYQRMPEVHIERWMLEPMLNHVETKFESPPHIIVGFGLKHGDGTCITGC